MSSMIELLKAISVLRKDYPNGIPLSIFSDKTSSQREIGGSSEAETDLGHVKKISNKDDLKITIKNG